MTAEAAATPPTFVHSFRDGLKKNWLVYTTFVVLVMALAGLIVSINSISATRAQAKEQAKAIECQNRYNAINNERTRLLSAVNDRERAAETAADSALAQFVDALAQDLPNDVKVQRFAVLQTKLSEQERTRAEGDREREEHPVPPPPQALCGG